MTDIEIRIADLTVLDLKPGDKILLRTELYLDDAECTAITARFERELPGHQVLVLEGGVELAVLRPVPAPQSATAEEPA